MKRKKRLSQLIRVTFNNEHTKSKGVSTPNEVTRRAIANIEEGKDLKQASSPEDLLKRICG